MDPQFQNEMNALIAQIPPRQRSRIEELTEQIERHQVKERKRLLILQAFLCDTQIAAEKCEQRLRELDRE